MKILLTIHQFFPKWFSGTEVLTLETATELMKRGHEVRVLAADPSDYETAVNTPLQIDYYNGITIYRFNHNFGTTRNPVRYEYCNDAISGMVREICRDFQPDIVHIFHCSRLSAAIIDIFAELNIPTVFTATDFWLLCPFAELRLPDNSPCRGPNINSTNCLKCYVSKTQPPQAIEKLHNTPAYLLEIASMAARFALVEHWEKGTILRALVRRKKYLMQQINKTNAIIAPTDLMIDLLTANGVKTKITKLPFGLNTQYQKENKQNKRFKGNIKFAYIGTLSEHKGVHILIDAFLELVKTYKNIELKIYGEPQHFPDYFALLKNKADGHDEIKFLGTFPNPQIGEIFEDIDVIVVPSIWYENTPLVILSAFNSKTPVIATNLGGMTEIVHHNENGLIFEKGNSLDLSEQMARLLNEPDLLEQLSSGIVPVNSMEDTMDVIEKIYYSIRPDLEWKPMKTSKGRL